MPDPTPLAVPIDPARDHGLGRWDAPVRLVEYGDYECPGCRRAYPMLDRLRESCGDDLLFVFRHFPLFTLHEHASVAAQAAEAAGQQGKFWPMHDLLYANDGRLEPPDLTHLALRIGLEIYRFENALADETYLRRVQADYRGGVESGVRGTPTLFVNGVKYAGPVDETALADAVKAARAAARV